MPVERCAALMAAAMWAGLAEAWISPQPLLLYVYLAQVHWMGCGGIKLCWKVFGPAER